MADTLVKPRVIRPDQPKMPKCFYLWGWSGERNTGDDVFLYTAAWGLRKYMHAKSLFMDSDRSGKAAARAGVQVAFSQRIRAPGFGRLRRQWLRFRSQAFVFAGGSLLNEPATVRAILQDRHWQKSNRLMLGLGLSVGPFRSSEHEDLTERLLDQMAFVGLRDDFSADWVEQRGVTSPTARALDLAVLLPVAANLPRPRGERGRTLGVALLGQQFLRDPALRPLDVKLAAELGKETAAVAARDGCEVIAFSLCCHPVYDDRIVTRAFVEACRGCQVKIFEHDGDPIRTFGRIRECSHFVSMRLHGGVLAYAAEVPFLMLGYHPKCRDFARTIGLEEQFCMSSDRMQPKAYGDRLVQLLAQSAVPARMSLAAAQQRALLNFQPSIICTR
jgi:polysaccharide pyruvyl transferase WcaK-like protein